MLLPDGPGPFFHCFVNMHLQMCFCFSFSFWKSFTGFVKSYVICLSLQEKAALKRLYVQSSLNKRKECVLLMLVLCITIFVLEDAFVLLILMRSIGVRWPPFPKSAEDGPVPYHRAPRSRQSVIAFLFICKLKIAIKKMM
uniref:Uncharacterized protein n=1 Tax=Rhipicephalus zambeziensis TaxID=60191 RepID=A0A224YK86_9ACAR